MSKKGIFITKKQFDELISKITYEGQQALKKENFSSDIMLMDLLSSTKALLTMKNRLFEDNDEE